LFVARLVAVHLGWDHTLLDDHGFRQTQTAISAYYMVGRPPQLAYETPVLGPPWSIPLEFPLYQWLVAGLVTLLGTPLDQTGRFVSVLFFLLTLLPGNALLRRLQLPAEGRLIILGLFLLSPFYLFWSRTFLIESTALFLSTSYLTLAWGTLEAPSPGRGAAAVVFGCLAGAVKVTTFAPFFLAVAVLAARAWWQRRRSAARPAGSAVWLGTVAVLLIAPVGATALWTRFADQQKDLNPLGKTLTSLAMRTWNFGTLHQRLDLDLWATLCRRATRAVDLPFLLLGLAGLLLTRRRWRAAGVCAALYLSAPLIFFNLHQHTYYAYANNLFLIAAAGLGVVALLEAGRVGRALTLLALPFLFGLECHRHQQWYGPVLENNPTLALRIGQAIEGATQEDEVILSLGMPWTSEIAYYSKRRALMAEGSAADCLRALPQLRTQLQDYRIGALVLHNRSLGPLTSEETQKMLAVLGPGPREVYEDQFVKVYAVAR
jgi:hypothetical protein